jgi:hypothetical protein
MTKLNRWEQSIYNSGLIAQQAASAAKIAELEKQLADAKAEHGKTLLLLNTAAFETIPELERRCLILEDAHARAIGFVPAHLTFNEYVKELRDMSERKLVAEGKIPQIEVKS